MIAIWLLSPTMALAQTTCTEPSTLNQSQVHDLLSIIEDDMSPSVDQVLAFTTLLCSDQPMIRDLALRAGAASHSASIQSATLFQALARMQVVTVELENSEGLSRAHYAYLEHNRFNHHTVTYVDHAKACLSLGQSDRCDRDMRIMVTGREVVMTSLWQGHASDVPFDAIFTYRGGDYLSGDLEMRVGNASLVFPVEIWLF